MTGCQNVEMLYILSSRLPVFLSTLLIALPALAQRPETDAKGGAYADRLKDEIRARKMYEKTARAAIPARFRQALEAHQPGERDLAATWGEFTTAGGTPFAALQLAVPAGVSTQSLTLFGIAGDASYFEDIAVQQSHGDAFVERSILLPPGKTRGTFGLARKNEILGMARVELEPPSDLSRLILSSDVHLLPAAQDPLDPFAFGGTKVVPKPRGVFRRSDEVWVFLEMRSATVPDITTKLDIEGANATIAGAPAPAAATPLKGVAGHYGVGNTIDITGLKPGDYRVKVTVTDNVAKTSITREARLKLSD
jgi:hypothetical protein